MEDIYIYIYIYIYLVGKPEMKILFRKPKLICKDNIKIDLEETWCEGVD
jgi:hypothetical protein